MLALVAPGQGAQTPGMLAPWLRDHQFGATITGWSEVAGLDLAHLGTKASAAEIARTEHTQPLLVAQGLLALGLLADDEQPVVVAGHSVGELTAAAYAGILDPADAVCLAAARGRAMAEACTQADTSMSAVVGGDQERVLGTLHELDLVPANFNGSGQIVAAGATRDLERLAAHPPEGAAVKPLAVAGAFHTRYMAPAQQAFAAAVASVTFHTPDRLVLSNTGGFLSYATDVQDHLVAQLTRPVRWDRCLHALASLEPAIVIALPPARPLAGILRRHLPEPELLSVSSPRDLGAARRRLVADPDGGPIRAAA